MEAGQWVKEFQWHLSDGTSAELVVSGTRPSLDDIEILEAELGIAKRVLEKIAKEPPQEEPARVESIPLTKAKNESARTADTPGKTAL